MTRASSVIEDIEYEEIITENRNQTAILFLIDGEEVWLDNEHTDIDDDRKVVTVPLWLARKKGISKLS